MLEDESSGVRCKKCDKKIHWENVLCIECATRSVQEGTTTLIELAEAVFPNSRAMTREERRAFDASAWSDLEPVEIVSSRPAQGAEARCRCGRSETHPLTTECASPAVPQGADELGTELCSTCGEPRSGTQRGRFCSSGFHIAAAEPTREEDEAKRHEESLLAIALKIRVTGEHARADAIVRAARCLAVLRQSLASAEAREQAVAEAVEGWSVPDLVDAQYAALVARLGDDADANIRCGVANLRNANRIIRTVRAALSPSPSEPAR